MVFNVSTAPLFGVALGFMVCVRMAPVGGSIVAFLFGFYAAATGSRPGRVPRGQLARSRPRLLPLNRS